MKSMQSVCAPAGPRTPALPAYFQDQVISFSRRKKQRRSDQGQKQKQLMSNADVCVISSEQGGAIILEITRKVMM